MNYCFPRFKILSFLPISLFLLIVLIPSGCKREFELYRFIDEMMAKNIISSPLTTLTQSYEIKEQSLRSENFFLYEYEGKKYRAVHAKFPLIAGNETEKPEGMTVFKNDQKILFIGDIQGNINGWMWTRFIKHIEPEQNRDFEKFKQGNTLILSKGEYYTAEKFYIPKDMVEFQIYAGSQNPEKYALHLNIFLGERLIKKLPVKKMELYKFTQEMQPGTYQLKIGFSEVEKYSHSSEREQLVLDAIELKSANDFILQSYSTHNPKTPNTDKFRAIYHTYVGDKKLYPMYLMKTKHLLLDLGIGENPLEMKKKLMIRDQSINAIFSPPKTVLRYDIKIPESGVLDFGYGLMQEAWRKKGDGVQFHINIKAGDKEDRLFSSNINPFQHVEHRKVFREKIDLTGYGNKKVEFVFITEKNNGIHNDLSYWCNPCIYQQKDPLNKKKKRPTNVILISLDTLRADHLGCYGYFRDTSPNIDSLSRDSVQFNYCYSTAASTLVAHMSLMTSLNPKSHQVYNDKKGDKLSPDLLTIADVLRGHGYYCGALTGSGLVSAIFGFSKGFDEYHEDRNSIFIGDSAETLYANASRWLNYNSDKKFFLFLHTYQPHNPYKNSSSLGKAFLDENSEWQQINLMKLLRDLESKNPVSYPSDIEDRAKRILENYLFRFRVLSDNERQNIVDLYDGEIRHTDEYLIKPLLSELKRLNIYENTMIILLSDHGESFQEHKMWEHGVQLYNELIRVPLIIKYPGSKHRGSTIANSVGIIDILPSILEELGIAPNSQFEGKHVHDIINRVEDSDRICYAETRTGGRKISLVKGRDKLILNGAPKSVYHLIGIPSQIEYYDLHKDVSEKDNIEVENTADLNVLFKQLIEYWKGAQNTGERPQKRVELPEDLEEQLKALGYIK